MLEWEENCLLSLLVHSSQITPNETCNYFEKVTMLDGIYKTGEQRESGFKLDGRFPLLPSGTQPSGCRAGCWLLGGQDHEPRAGQPGGARWGTEAPGPPRGAQRSGPGNVLSQEKHSPPPPAEPWRGCRAGKDIADER